ncbi:MAG TPA: lipoprotein [Tianweitania sediminis]|nr:lipoprotein [Tianweitania sediminis]
MTLSRSLCLVALVAAFALGGCGRKADLDTPSEAANAARQNTGIGINQPAEPAPPPAPERRFILDPLI